MKTARQRAEFWLAMNVAGYTEAQVDYLEVFAKEQDKITRHACAEAVMDPYLIAGETSFTNKLTIVQADAHNACMNVKAV